MENIYDNFESLTEEDLEYYREYVGGNPIRRSPYTMSYLDDEKPKITKVFNVEHDGKNNLCVNIKGFSKPFRARSEMLIIHRDKVLLSDYKPGSKDIKTNRKIYSRDYKVSGGGWDIDEDPKDAAIRETQEEFLINTKNVKHAGWFLINNAVPKWVSKIPANKRWNGYYVELYIGEYNGIYKGHVDEEDKEENTLKSIKAYKIDDIKDNLTPEHQQAISDYLNGVLIESTSNNIFYHGSHNDIKGNYVLPKNNSHEDNTYVFGTNDRNFALAFAGNPWNDSIIRQGYYNGQPYLVEVKKNAFDKTFNTDGYIYSIRMDSPFQRRSGSKEYLSKNRADIMNREYVKNVLDEIKKSNIELYEYPNKPKWLNESKDESNIDDKFKKKSGYTFKIISIKDAVNQKYIEPNWNTDNKDGVVAICNQTNKVAGFIYVNKQGNIGPLRVYDDYKGYGLSNDLMKWATTHGGKTLGVYKDNQVAMNLYKKFGFKETDEKKGKGDNEAIFMTREATEEKSEVFDKIKEFNKELNSWDYGVLVNGKVITDSSKVDWSKYKTIPIKDIEKYHVGICWDFVNYEFDWFNKKRIGTETYMFVMQKSDDPQDIVTHTFLIFNLEGKKYWFESSWFGHQGVKEVKSYKDVVKELVDKYGDHSYSVYKYNPKGLDNHVDNGEFFRKTTKNLVDDYVVKESSYINEEYIEESYIKNEKDIYYNKAAFDNGDINLCFITGLSGSGKSTMGQKMESSDNIEHSNLDNLQTVADNYTMEELKNYGDLFYNYFKGPGKKFYITYDELVEKGWSNAEYEDKLFPGFVHFAMSYAAAHKDKKFVVEGIWLFGGTWNGDKPGRQWFTPDEFKKYAFYIKGTSLLVSKFRAAKRDSKEEWVNGSAKELKGINRFKAFTRNFFLENWKYYLVDEKRLSVFRKYFEKQDNTIRENHEPINYLTEKAVEQLDEALNLGDMLLLFNEDAKNDALLKKLLYTGRMKTRKDLLEYYDMVKNDNPWIRYAYPELSRFQKRNLFIDTSYYNNLFFNNNTWTMKKGLGIFFDYMERVLKHASLKETGYEKLTIMIPILGWGVKDNLWNYRESLNPISMIYQYMYTGNLNQLRKVFKDTDILFVATDKYFKINFKDITANDIKKYALKFKIFIQKIVKNEVFDPEDIDNTADNMDSAEVIQAKIADKIEDSRGVDITPQLAKARSGSKAPIKDEKPEPGSVTKTRLNQKDDPEKDSQDRVKQKIADDIVYSTKDTMTNSEDDVLDSLDQAETKALILDLDPEDEDGVVVSPGRVTRMNQLNDKFLQSNIKGQTIRDILADNRNKEEVKTKLNVSTPFDDWDSLGYVNFDKNYNLDKDILACFYHLQGVSRPISIRKIEVKDNSTSEDRVELYTVSMEDYRGKQFTIKLDIPIMVDNRFLLRGNYKSIQTQFFNMPIIKTEEDTVQIISNYMKIFVRRFRTGNGRALPETARLVKALHKYKGKEVTIITGDNSKVCSKYNLPIDYIDISSEFSKIETSKSIYYFNQDEIYKIYGDKIDTSKGIPYIYRKDKKEIDYYRAGSNVTFTQSFMGNFEIDKAFDKIRVLFDESKAPSVCTFSRASILNSQIPLVVICAYHVGLRSVLDRAAIDYKISEKLTKEDKLNYGDYLKFKDGYVFYKPTYSSSMLLNGLKESNLTDYSLAEMDSRTMYLELLDNYGGRIKADGLDNFRDLMVDPMTKETLEFYHMPTDYIDILIYANNLLADNKFVKHTDASSRRLRRYQLIAVYTYKVLADAYYNYAIQLKHTENVAEFMIKQSAVIDKFLTDSITSDDSVINPLMDIETTNRITTKGPSGMNADRAYSLDKRTYDDSMLNVVGMSTGFAGNVGITRQATMNANVTSDGYVKTIDGKTDKMNTANTLTATEALTPFGSTHDDPMRTAMTFIQTSKHQVRTVDSDPLLVTNGSDEALPYMSTDRFAFKAKKKGKIEELTDDYIIIKYLDGTKDFVNLTRTIEKNSDGGYYVGLKLDKNSTIKEGSNVEPGQIIAYDRESYSNSAGETDNLSYNIGKLGKIAILNTDEGFEDSGIISNRMADALATPIDYKFDKVIDKDSIIYDIVKVGDHVEVGDSLLTYQSPFEDEDANALMKVMGDDIDVSDLGKRKITSEITGTVTAIKMFRTVETSEMSDSLKKIVNAYEKPLKEMKKKLEENNLDTSQVPAHYVLPAVGKLKKAEDAVLIEIYVEYLDTVGPGDKVVYFSANKAVEKNIFPVGKEPYTAYRPNEIIDGFVSETSIMKRMVCSTLTIGSINKLMIELDRHVKDIMGIPYDDSKV